MKKFIIGLLSIGLITSAQAGEKRNLAPIRTDVEDIRAMDHAEASRVAQQQGAELKRLESEIRTKERQLNQLVKEVHDLKVQHVGKAAQLESARRYAEHRDLDDVRDVAIDAESLQAAQAPRPMPRTTAYRSPAPYQKGRMHHPMR